MIISMQDAVLMLQIYAALFNCFINIYHLLIMKKYVKKYSLNIILHILMQHVNSLIIIINIQNKNFIIKNTNYSIMIIYFKTLTKHLNAKERINITEMTLFNHCFRK